MYRFVRLQNIARGVQALLLKQNDLNSLEDHMYWDSVRLTLDQRKTLHNIVDQGPEGNKKVFLSRALLWMDKSPGGPGLDELRVCEAMRLSPQVVREV